jgi:DNA modification methylase
VTGQAIVIRGDALHVPLRDGVADMVCTSPPYLWKRKYVIEGTGELGNEQDWRQYLDHLFAATDEMLRVLKPTGSIWVNLGDTRVTGTGPKWCGIPVKSRLLLPERYRVGCQDRYARRGVIVRQVQIWEKANSLPESVDDRTRDSHEDWVHIVKRRDYYSAIDEIRAPHQPQSLARAARAYNAGDQFSVSTPNTLDPEQFCNPLGKLPGSVWRIASEPLSLPAWIDTAHYAAFPTEVARRIVLAFTPNGICTACGTGQVPVVDRGDQVAANGAPMLEGEAFSHYQGRKGAGAEHGDQRRVRTAKGYSFPTREATILGYACQCTPHTNHPGTGESHPRASNGWATANDQHDNPGGGLGNNQRVGAWREYHLAGWTAPPTRPAVVCDPFGGTGTTAAVAKALGRIGVSIDLSEAYSRLAADRTLQAQRAAKVTGRRNQELQGILL